MARLIFLTMLLLPILSAAVVQQYTFDGPPTNWVIENRSDGPPNNSLFSDGWVHSDDVGGAAPIFGNDSDSDPYMYTSVFASNLGPGSIASTWLVAPVVDLRIARHVEFYTIGVPPIDGPYPDRMQIRFRQGTDAATLNAGDGGIGVTADDQGLYTQLLLDINPTYDETGYQQTWTKYTVQLPSASALNGNFGRLAFRYYISDASVFGNAVALDDVTFHTPEPASFVLIGIPLVALGLFRRRTSHKTP